MAYYFNVNVERIDDDLKNDSKRWMVQRKDQDFYTLKAKLVEFHGENEFSDSILPSRRYLLYIYIHSFMPVASLRLEFQPRPNQEKILIRSF